MSDYRLSFPACVVAGKIRLSAEDMLLLRKYTFPEGIKTSDDVVTLLTLDACCPEKCPQWRDYFVEQLAHFIVHHCYPIGSLDEINVDWLRQVLCEDGVLASEIALETVLHVMDITRFVPLSLTLLMLDQLRVALEEQRGAYAARRTAGRAIGPDDMAFIKRVLRDRQEPGEPALSPATIATLEALDRATSPRPAEWHGAAGSADHLRNGKTPPLEQPRRWLQVPDSFFLQDEMVA
ncbi:MULTISPECIES: hypothetical protein [Alphaproteobacteria]|uniref:Uncharacterized protein n=2 Tax=Alphaproteobacteria TaxID=28211 RepID=A0A512HDA6_9HYPH|nr:MULTISPECIES: hypothetical protein [Alphaproteobacteria]GEO83434.1 hypothetical protein RNA01_03660 [Ciceribacter naphthalenivorans]GLR22993.1 hypothetical protein GCM10007920_27810 [Ciceribacter naphthalenivorans]GLT05849.1 hypothetical protein GCM10007926_27810 [Sphingomonas psychrolutea]